MISCNTHSFKRSFKSLQKGLSIICPPSCDCENMIFNQPSKTKFRVSFTSKKAHLPHNLGNLVNKLIIFILLHIEDPPLGNSIEEFPSSLRDQLGGMTTITAMSLFSIRNNFNLELAVSCRTISMWNSQSLHEHFLYSEEET